MAKCVGCGLEVNSGILEVKTKTGGGITCDPTDGLSVLFPAAGDPNNQLGCGITSDASGKLAVDLCPDGGLACGDVGGGTSCLYVDINNQGTGACVDIGTVQPLGGYNVATQGGYGGASANFSPGGNCMYNGCNGLVRTCDGLWAPPKIPECSGILSEQSTAATMGDILFSKTSMDSRFPGSSSGANEWAVAAMASSTIAQWCCCLPHYPASCVRMTGNTFTNGTTPIILVAQGQVHRFTVWESLRYASAVDTNCAETDFSTTGWSLQNQILFDEFGAGKSSGYSSAFIDSSWLINDVPGNCIMGQMCITYQRFGSGPTNGSGAPNDSLSGAFALKREYLHTMHGSHCTSVQSQNFRPNNN